MQTSIAVEALLDERECARQLGVSVHLLRRWRQQGTGIPYLKIGRLVKYAPADLSTFLEGRRIETAGEVTR